MSSFEGRVFTIIFSPILGIEKISCFIFYIIKRYLLTFKKYLRIMKQCMQSLFFHYVNLIIFLNTIMYQQINLKITYYVTFKNLLHIKAQTEFKHITAQNFKKLIKSDHHVALNKMIYSCNFLISFPNKNKRENVRLLWKYLQIAHSE